MVQVLEDPEQLLFECRKCGIGPEYDRMRIDSVGRWVHVMRTDESDQTLKCRVPEVGEIWFGRGCLRTPESLGALKDWEFSGAGGAGSRRSLTPAKYLSPQDPTAPQSLAPLQNATGSDAVALPDSSLEAGAPDFPGSAASMQLQTKSAAVLAGKVKALETELSQGRETIGEALFAMSEMQWRVHSAQEENDSLKEKIETMKRKAKVHAREARELQESSREQEVKVKELDKAREEYMSLVRKLMDERETLKSTVDEAEQRHAHEEWKRQRLRKGLTTVSPALDAKYGAQVDSEKAAAGPKPAEHIQEAYNALVAKIDGVIEKRRGDFDLRTLQNIRQSLRMGARELVKATVHEAAAEEDRDYYPPDRPGGDRPPPLSMHDHAAGGAAPPSFNPYYLGSSEVNGGKRDGGGGGGSDNYPQLDRGTAREDMSSAGSRTPPAEKLSKLRKAADDGYRPLESVLVGSYAAKAPARGGDWDVGNGRRGSSQPPGGTMSRSPRLGGMNGHGMNGGMNGHGMNGHGANGHGMNGSARGGMNGGVGSIISESGISGRGRYLREHVSPGPDISGSRPWGGALPQTPPRSEPNSVWGGSRAPSSRSRGAEATETMHQYHDFANGGEAAAERGRRGGSNLERPRTLSPSPVVPGDRTPRSNVYDDVGRRGSSAQWDRELRMSSSRR